MMRPNVKRMLFAMLLLATFSAHAEKADRDQPIDLEADTLTTNDAKKTSTYTGNVILTQGTLRINADNGGARG